jgi:hypothetical protein
MIFKKTKVKKKKKTKLMVIFQKKSKMEEMLTWHMSSVYNMETNHISMERVR